MAGPIDEAYVEIRPDVDDFAKETNREVTSALRDVERKLDDVAETIEDSFDRLIFELKDLFDDLQFAVETTFEAIERDARHAGENIDDTIRRGANRAERAIDDMADEAERDLERVQRQARRTGFSLRGMVAGLGSGLGAAGGGIIQQLSGLGGTLRNLGQIPATIGDLVFTIVKLTAVASAFPTILALVGAIIDLGGVLLTLPGFVGVALGAIAPLIIAFQGMGDAVSALISGDMEKLNESLKKLAPSARSVVLEIKTLLTPLRNLKRSVQEAFFGQIKGQIATLGRVLLPVLNTGFTEVAVSLGKVAAAFLELLGANDILVAIKTILGTTAGFVERFGLALVDGFGAFFGQMEAALPFVFQFADWFVTLIDRFTEWQAKNMANGNWNSWIEIGIETLKDLGALAGSVFNLIMSLAGDTGDEGRTLIETFTEMFNKLADFFRSEDGQEFIEDMMTSVAALVKVILGFGIAIANVARWISEAKNAFIATKQSISDFWTSTKEIAANLWSTVTNAVSGAWDAVTGFFSRLPGQIGGFLSAIPGVLRDAAVKAFDTFTFNIGYGIGLVIKLFMELPGKIADIIVSLWNTAGRLLVDGFTTAREFLQSIPGWLVNLFKDAFTRTRTTVADGGNRVIDALKELPGRAASAVASLPGKVLDILKGLISGGGDIGRRMIDGLIDGIQSAVGRLNDAARRAVTNALNGAKRALGIASPSKEWAKMGVQSVQGYDQGVQREMPRSATKIAETIQMPMDMFDRRGGSNARGGDAAGGVGDEPVTVIVQIGDEQIKPTFVRIIRSVPQEVALAAESGNVQRSERR